MKRSLIKEWFYR